jgi:hypothetical protein
MENGPIFPSEGIQYFLGIGFRLGIVALGAVKFNFLKSRLYINQE